MRFLEKANSSRENVEMIKGWKWGDLFKGKDVCWLIGYEVWV